VAALFRFYGAVRDFVGGSLFETGFVYDLNGVDERVVDDGFEFEQQFALRVGLQTLELSHQGAILTAGFTVNVKVFQQGFTVAKDWQAEVRNLTCSGFHLRAPGAPAPLQA
jgi:hypothetical protein